RKSNSARRYEPSRTGHTDVRSAATPDTTRGQHRGAAGNPPERRLQPGYVCDGGPVQSALSKRIAGLSHGIRSYVLKTAMASIYTKIYVIGWSRLPGCAGAQ